MKVSVDHGIFHYFHQAWTIEISYALNGGILPPGYFALAEQVLGGPIPDVVTLQRQSTESLPGSGGGLALADAPPQARFVTSVDADIYADRANRILIKHDSGQVVAVIEILSPGNKSSQQPCARSWKRRATLAAGNHAGGRSLPALAAQSAGHHKAIWDSFCDEPFELPSDKPLTAAAYFAGAPKKPTSSRSLSAMCCPVCRCSSTPTSMFLRSWNQLTKPRGRSARPSCGRW